MVLGAVGQMVDFRRQNEINGRLVEKPF